MSNHRIGRPPLSPPLVVNRMRFRGVQAGALQVRGGDTPAVIKLITERYHELMGGIHRFDPKVVEECDRLCLPIPQRGVTPYGDEVELAPRDPLHMALVDAWYMVSQRSPAARDFLMKHFDAVLDVTGLGRPVQLASWCKMLDGLLMARNHPDYKIDPVAAYRAAGLCA